MTLQLPDQILLASHNTGKLREFANLFAPYNIQMISAVDYDLPEPEETGTTFAANALLKARAAAKATGLAALSDDSGLCVTALNGDPGIYSARWAGGAKDFNIAMQKVLDLLSTEQDRSAAFTATLALVLPDETEMTFEGRIEGMIAAEPRGSNGFGYDPIFIPTGDTRTFGEMSLQEKKAHNHRVRAFEKLKQEILISCTC